MDYIVLIDSTLVGEKLMHLDRVDRQNPYEG